jgi:hypothetical protein
MIDSLKAQFQPVDEPSNPAVIEMVDEAMRTNVYALAREQMLTDPLKVLQASKALKGSKTPKPNGTPNRVLRHLSKRAIVLTEVFNAELPPAEKNGRVVSTLIPGRNSALSSYKPVSLIDTDGKLSEKILLTAMRKVNERGPLRDQQFGFRSRHSTSLQLARLVEVHCPHPCPVTASFTIQVSSHCG